MPPPRAARPTCRGIAAARRPCSSIGPRRGRSTAPGGGRSWWAPASAATPSTSPASASTRSPSTSRPRRSVSRGSATPSRASRTPWRTSSPRPPSGPARSTSSSRTSPFRRCPPASGRGRSAPSPTRSRRAGRCSCSPPHATMTNPPTARRGRSCATRSSRSRRAGSRPCASRTCAACRRRGDGGGARSSRGRALVHPDARDAQRGERPRAAALRRPRRRPGMPGHRHDDRGRRRRRRSRSAIIVVAALAGFAGMLARKLRWGRWIYLVGGRHARRRGGSASRSTAS